MQLFSGKKKKQSVENKTADRPQASGYSEGGASIVRRALKGFRPNSSSPHRDIDDQNCTLRQRSRLLYMTSPVATSAIQTNRTKVVGMGLTLKSAINREVLGLSPERAKEWQKHTESEFRMWAKRKENCDAIGMNNFSALQQLAMKSWLMSGDVFALLCHVPPTKQNPYSLRIQLIEADRVSTPYHYGSFAIGCTEGKDPKTQNRIFDGVEVNTTGCVEAYHVCSHHPNDYAESSYEWQRVPCFGGKTGMPNILHITDSERPGQYRGVPYLAPVIEQMLQLRRYTESELMAALVQSFFTAWVTTETDPSGIPFNEVGGGVPGENPPDSIYETDNEYQMGPGTVLHLAENEKVSFGNPNIPTAGFETFLNAICRQIGCALELPRDVLMKEFNKSYSASRAALMEAWESFRMKRSWFIDDFCQPVYETWLAEAVALGRIQAPGFWDDPLVRDAWCGARWIGPTQGQLDPKKEVDAAIAQVREGFKTHEQITREMGGGDWEENVEQLHREAELLTNVRQVKKTKAL